MSRGNPGDGFLVKVSAIFGSCGDSAWINDCAADLTPCPFSYASPFQETDINGRLFCLAFVAGAGAVQCLAALPGLAAYAAAAGACVAALLACRRWPGRLMGLCMALTLGLCLGAINAAVQAQLRLNDALADEHQNEVARLVLRVAELPDGDARGQRFVGEQVAPARPGIPSRIIVSWLAPPGAVGSAVADARPDMAHGAGAAPAERAA